MKLGFLKNGPYGSSTSIEGDTYSTRIGDRTSGELEIMRGEVGVITSLNDLAVGMNLKGKTITFDTTVGALVFTGGLRAWRVYFEGPSNGYIEITSIARNIAISVGADYTGIFYSSWQTNTYTFPTDGDYIITSIQTNENPISPTSPWQFHNITSDIRKSSLHIGTLETPLTLYSPQRIVVKHNDSIQEVAYLSDISGGGGGVTSITAGTGLTGGTITSSGTIAHQARPAGQAGSITTTTPNHVVGTLLPQLPLIQIDALGHVTTNARRQNILLPDNTLIGNIPGASDDWKVLSAAQVNTMLDTVLRNTSGSALTQTLDNTTVELNHTSALNLWTSASVKLDGDRILQSANLKYVTNIDQIGSVKKGDFVDFSLFSPTIITPTSADSLLNGEIFLRIDGSAQKLYSAFAENSPGQLTLIYDSGEWLHPRLILTEGTVIPPVIGWVNAVDLRCHSSITYNASASSVIFGTGNKTLQLDTDSRIGVGTKETLAYLSDLQRMPWMNGVNTINTGDFNNDEYNFTIQNNSSYWVIEDDVHTLGMYFQPNCLYPIIVRFTTGDVVPNITFREHPNQHLFKDRNPPPFTKENSYEVTCINNVVRWIELASI